MLCLLNPIERISPPAWGWPGFLDPRLLALDDFPTRVGMARGGAGDGRADDGFPHPRGDGPGSSVPKGTSCSISPPAWGWPAQRRDSRPHQPDFPTRVGMARIRRHRGGSRRRFPHPRGDGPKLNFSKQWLLAISPPAWGWPANAMVRTLLALDFPTRVGMARKVEKTGGTSPGFPHPRGDGPFLWNQRTATRLISPPAWGWPVCRRNSRSGPSDFPTRVGMARTQSPTSTGSAGFPHPRGDGPYCRRAIFRRIPISPPAWGWPARG